VFNNVKEEGDPFEETRPRPTGDAVAPAPTVTAYNILISILEIPYLTPPAPPPPFPIFPEFPEAPAPPPATTRY
jgi:hypothetical protein